MCPWLVCLWAHCRIIIKILYFKREQDAFVGSQIKALGGRFLRRNYTIEVVENKNIKIFDTDEIPRIHVWRS